MRYFTILFILMFFGAGTRAQSRNDFALGFADSISSTILHEERPLLIFDRMMGYGLKFTDDFKHTSLGWMGNTNQLEQ